MRISDWSSDVCSSDRAAANESRGLHYPRRGSAGTVLYGAGSASRCSDAETTSPQYHYLTALSPRATDRLTGRDRASDRSEEPTSELQSLMRITYAVFCLKKKKHASKLLKRNPYISEHRISAIDDHQIVRMTTLIDTD